jgi:hypothetical protein
MALRFSLNNRMVDGTRSMVTFTGLDQGKNVVCHISFDALKHHCGLGQTLNDEVLAAFDANRGAIEAIAKRKHAAGLVGRNGRVFIDVADF